MSLNDSELLTICRKEEKIISNLKKKGFWIQNSNISV